MKAIYKKSLFSDNTTLSVMKVTKNGTARIGRSGDVSSYPTDVTDENDISATQQEFKIFLKRALIIHNNAISKLLEL